MKKYLAFSILFLLLSCHAPKKAKQDSPTPPKTETTPPKPPAPKVDMRKQIIEDSKPGGGLDFFSPIKGHETEEVEVKDGIWTTRLGLALYDWGKATQSLGIKTAAEALDIWAEFKGRAVNATEKENISLGYRRAWE